MPVRRRIVMPRMRCQYYFTIKKDAETQTEPEVVHQSVTVKTPKKLGVTEDDQIEQRVEKTVDLRVKELSETQTESEVVHQSVTVETPKESGVTEDDQIEQIVEKSVDQRVKESPETQTESEVVHQGVTVETPKELRVAEEDQIEQIVEKTVDVKESSEMKVNPRLFLMSSSCGTNGNLALIQFLRTYNVKKVLVLPYASLDHEWKTYKTATVLDKYGFKCEGIQYFKDQIEAIENAEAIYIVGGNTFLLLRDLHQRNLVDVIRKRVLKDGIPYVGTSAGINVATPGIHTTNDMPITYPPTFDGFNFVPFNINPHYAETENRDTKITEYVNMYDKTCVAMRDGSCFHIADGKIKLIGLHRIKIFRRDMTPREYHKDFDLSFLLTDEPPPVIRQYRKVFV